MRQDARHKMKGNEFGEDVLKLSYRQNVAVWVARMVSNGFSFYLLKVYFSYKFMYNRGYLPQ